MERLKGFAAKRNKIVHGQWVPEIGIDADDKGRPIVAQYTWKRTVSTQSASVRNQTSSDPKARHSLWFLEEDLLSIAQNIEVLRADVNSFSQSVVPLNPEPLDAQPVGSDA